MSFDWQIGLVTNDQSEESWQELSEAIRLFFDRVRFEHPSRILKEGFNHDFVFTDNKHVFIRAQEGSIRCLYLPIPTMRRQVAELLRVMAFSFLTPDAYKDKE
jgi:hypothetical protein